MALMPRGAILVNGARGGVVDEVALAEALRSGASGSAALDMRAQEPPSPADPLRALDNVLLTPHVAGLTRQSQQAIAPGPERHPATLWGQTWRVTTDPRRVTADHLEPLLPMLGRLSLKSRAEEMS